MRNRHFLLLDALLFGILPFLALALRVESFSWPSELRRAVVLYALAAVAARLTIAFSLGLYRCLWRHASIAELQRILYAGALAAVATFFLGTVGLTATGLSPIRLPYSMLVLDAMLALGVMAGPRLLERFAHHKGGLGAGRRTIIVGAGEAGQMILREARNNERMRMHVVAFVDDDPYKQRQLLGNVPVVGRLADLPSLIGRLGAAELVIAMPAARGSVVRKVVQAATDAGIPARTMPSMHDLITGRVSVSALRRVEIQDLLRRDAIVTDLDAVRRLATSHAVLVTGAGGSIGSELCRQIGALAPARLVLLDHSENQVFEIERELRPRFPLIQIVPVIADVRDASRIHAIFGLYKPYAVFHAAAHKHVPLMEENIVEAITNNVLGTRNVVDASLDAEVAHLVNISTDKAVRPTSIMGATKRIAEKIVLNAARSEARNFVSVRFGNVLGSRGSVIPTFLQQIQAGGPVTVTHPEMRRYFMTIPEAVQLVLQAGALGHGGELFVLDMGEPVKIVDLARDLIRLSGLEEGADIEISYTGVRPGEKLYEEILFGGEDVRPTDHPKVLRTLEDTLEANTAAAVEDLIRSAATQPAHDAYLRDKIRALVPSFAHEDARTDPKLRPSPSSGVNAPRPAIST